MEWLLVYKKRRLEKGAHIGKSQRISHAVHVTIQRFGTKMLIHVRLYVLYPKMVM